MIESSKAFLTVLMFVGMFVIMYLVYCDLNEQISSVSDKDVITLDNDESDEDSLLSVD